MYGLFPLGCPVNENIKIVAAFGGNSDKLLIAAKIVYQCCIALWGKGRRFRFFHNNIAVVGRVLCGWLCGCPLCIGRDRKTAHKDKGGTKGSHGLFQFILHLHFPPVLHSLRLR